MFFVPQRCCDIMSVVYGSDAKIICHPDGGLTGKGDGMCVDFLVDRRNDASSCAIRNAEPDSCTLTPALLGAINRLNVQAE